jgi:hypothetical protein
MARWNGASLRSMGPRLIIVGSIGIVGSIRAYDPVQVWSKHSRRIVPMSLST